MSNYRSAAFVSPSETSQAEIEEWELSRGRGKVCECVRACGFG